LQKNKNKNNNNKLETEKEEEETLDESSNIKQQSMLLKVEKACHPTLEKETKRETKKNIDRNKKLVRFRLENCKLKQLKNEHSGLSCSRCSQSFLL
jgi:hypothetical protein